jgi:acetyl-CoA carboxylase biotin carboxyl carrier protein
MAEEVRAEMVANVLAVSVSEGEQVQPGQTLAILESMKMEMPVEAPASGKVEKISCSEGQAVNEGEVIVTLA